MSGEGSGQHRHDHNCGVVIQNSRVGWEEVKRKAPKGRGAETTWAGWKAHVSRGGTRVTSRRDNGDVRTALCCCTFLPVGFW